MKAIKAFIKRIGDMFLDQNDGTDEKRVLGIPIIVTAVVYVIVTGNLGVFGALAGLGTLLLGIAVGGDQGRLGISNEKGDPTAGIPGS